MFIAFNAILIALVLLIAYWWMNQGLFSALLHFACVVVAGCVAFAVWEPIAVLMLTKKVLPDYAWGISLLGSFSLTLFVCRLACDKLVPDNLNFPQWANFAFGGIFGLGAGMLTMGMCLIGGGFIQSSKDVMGFTGVVRTSNAHGRPDFDNQRLWVPMHSLTEDFYAWLSAGALAPETSRSLRDAYPGLADVAFSLHRDSYREGKARTSIPPSAITMKRFFYATNVPAPGQAEAPIWVVEMEIGMDATDSGGILSISASQVRLIERLAPGERRQPRSVHPSGFSQPADSGAAMNPFPFDDVTAFASNVPGAQSTRLFFIFPAGELGGMTNPPEFIQIKGLRVRLPAADQVIELGAAQMMLMLRGVDATSATAAPLTDPSKKTIRPKDLVNDASINPGQGAVGELGNMEQINNYLTYGKEVFQKGGKPASKANRINGIYTPEGTAILRLNISRGDSSIDIWNTRSEYRKEAGDEASLVLVDSQGNTFLPTGYLWVNGDGVEVYLDKANIQTVGQFPYQPSSGTNELYALYRVTTGATIVSVRLGNIVLANASYEVRGKDNP